MAYKSKKSKKDIKKSTKSVDFLQSEESSGEEAALQPTPPTVMQPPPSKEVRKDHTMSTSDDDMPSTSHK